MGLFLITNDNSDGAIGLVLTISISIIARIRLLFFFVYAELYL